MASTLLAIADAAVTKVAAWWTKGASDAVSRVYLPDIPDPTDPTGRQVWIVPHLFGQADIATRAQDRNSFTIYAIFAERFPANTAGEATKAWIDTRVDFVEDVWGLLSDARTTLFPSPLEDVVATDSRLVSLYDDDALREDKVFHAILELTYERDE